MATYDAVLFDLYDTLAWSAWREWQRAIAERIGVSVHTVGEAFDSTRPARNRGRYPDLAGDIAAIVAAAGVEPTPELVADLRDRELSTLDGTVHLFRDALPVLRELRERGVRTALVSNCSHNTRPVVERLGLERELDAVILSCEAGAAKPDPEIYRLALQRLDLPHRAAFVDDQVDYCDGAAAAGLETFLILRPEEATEPPVSANGHRVIADLAPLLD